MQYNLKSMKVLLYAFISVALLVLPVKLNAQELDNIGAVAIGITISDKVAEGDIVSYDGKIYKLASQKSDPSIYGVITMNPTVGVEDVEDGKGIYVLSQGQAKVRVSTTNGNIKKNDYITSSNTPGVGVKADSQGYILGTALSDYSGKEPGLIAVQLSPRWIGEEGSAPGNMNLFLIAAILVAAVIIAGTQLYIYKRNKKV